jgi:hypothetical protein
VGVTVTEHWKPRRLHFNFVVHLMVRLHAEQSRCHFSLMLILIEAKLSKLNLVKDYVHISSVFCSYEIIHISHVILHFSDGMNNLVADGVNSLRQGHVR